METELHAAQARACWGSSGWRERKPLMWAYRNAWLEAISPVDLDHPTVIASYALAAKRRYVEKIPLTFNSVQNDSGIQAGDPIQRHQVRVLAGPPSLIKFMALWHCDQGILGESSRDCIEASNSGNRPTRRMYDVRFDTSATAYISDLLAHAKAFRRKRTHQIISAILW